MSSLQRLRCSEQDERDRQFDQIVGSSAALESVLAEVERVAPTDSTVLVLGETGTGKELIARAIHNISPRCGRPFVKLNCAAIPFDLLESELFGHEKGAFTGAIAQKSGPLRNGGYRHPLPGRNRGFTAGPATETFARSAGTRVRAAGKRPYTSHQCPSCGRHSSRPGPNGRRNEFRSDLYYRLNVFPVLIPPLRERQDDIPSTGPALRRGYSPGAWGSGLSRYQNQQWMHSLHTIGPAMCGSSKTSLSVP